MIQDGILNECYLSLVRESSAVEFSVRSMRSKLLGIVVESRRLFCGGMGVSCWQGAVGWYVRGVRTVYGRGGVLFMGAGWNAEKSQAQF